MALTPAEIDAIELPTLKPAEIDAIEIPVKPGKPLSPEEIDQIDIPINPVLRREPPASLDNVPSSDQIIRINPAMNREVFTPTGGGAIQPDRSNALQRAMRLIGERLDFTPRTLENPSGETAKGFPRVSAADIAAGNIKTLLPGVDPDTGESEHARFAPSAPAPVLAQIAAGAQHAVAGTAEALVPFIIGGQVTTATRLPLLARGVSAYFAQDMLRALPETARTFVQAVEAGDVQTATESGVSGVLGAYFSYQAAKHAVGRTAVPQFDVKGEPIIDPKTGKQKVEMKGIAEESPAVRWLLTRRIATDYTPAEIREIYNRVNLGTANPAEQELVRFINKSFESPKQAIQSGVRLKTEQPVMESEFWRDYLGLKESQTTAELLKPIKLRPDAPLTPEEIDRIPAQLTEGTSNATNPISDKSGVQKESEGVTGERKKNEAASARDRLPSPAGEPKTEGKVTPEIEVAQAVAREINATFKPVGVFNLETVPENMRPEMERIQRQNGWEFTPQKDSPIAGQTFYVPIGASRDQIMQRYKEKIAEDRAANESSTKTKVTGTPSAGKVEQPAEPPAAPEPAQTISQPTPKEVIPSGKEKVQGQMQEDVLKPAGEETPPASPKSSTQLTLPKSEAEPFRAFAQSIPDAEVYHKLDASGKEDYGIETEPHITVLYGLTEHAPGPVANAIKAYGQIGVTLGKLSVFKGEDYDVLKVDVHSSALRELNQKIAKLPNEQTHPTYTPHLTIAYLKKGEGDKYVGDDRFNGKKLTFNTVTFSPPSEIRAKAGRPELPLTTPEPQKPTGSSLRKKGTKAPVVETKLAKTETKPVEKPPTAIKSPVANLKADELAELEALEKDLLKKLGGTYTGIDPEIAVLAAKMANLYAKGGVRTFEQFARNVKERVPSIWERIKAYLRAAWNQIADMLGFDEVSRADAERVFGELDKQPTKKESVTDERPVDQRKGGVEESDVETPSVSGGATGVPSGGQLGSDQPQAGASVGGGQKPDRTGTGGTVSGGGSPAPSEGTGDVPPVGSGGERDVRRSKSPPVTTASNYVITDADRLGEGSIKDKASDNLEAIRLVKLITGEKRPATTAEQAKLVRYVGWGGLKGVFDEDNAQFNKERAQLKKLLTDEEYAAARASIQDAHYTSQTVIQRGIYAALRRFGFNGGRMIEGGVGTGNFIGLMPVQMRFSSTYLGIERDNITAKIAQLLYPEAKILHQGYEEAAVARESFDAAVGNPPFGNKSIFDPRYTDASKFSIHNFFIGKTLEAIRPGGVVGFVVSRYFLDNSEPMAREYIAQFGRFLGAIRLPNTAFKQNANTQVVTDLVFFERVAKGTETDTSWTQVVDYKDEKSGLTWKVNKWVVDHPEMIMGTIAKADRGLHGKEELTVNPTGDLGTQLDAAVLNLPQSVYVPASRETTTRLTSAEVPAEIRVGSFFLHKSRVMRRLPDMNGETQAEPVEMKSASADRVRMIIPIRDALNALVRAEMREDSTDAEIERLRSKLNKTYDSFVKNFGFLNSTTNRRAFYDDTDSFRVLGLESEYNPGLSAATAKKKGVAEITPSAKKADIFTKRVNAPYQEITKVETAKEALTVSLNQRGMVDMEYMAGLVDKPADEVAKELGELVFRLPRGGWESREVYLSGDVRQKLKEAQDAAIDNPAFQHNVEALKPVIPKDIAASDIVAPVGAPWLEATDVAAFARELIGTDPSIVLYRKADAGWSFEHHDSGNNATQRWGTTRMPFGELFRQMLNGRPVTVWDTVDKPDGGEMRVVNEADTAAAESKANEVREKWKEWIWRDQERRERLHRKYNDTYNNFADYVADGSHLTLPGSSKAVTLRMHQKNIAWRTITSSGGGLLYDHVVGAGKTFAGVAGMMELRRIGRVRKWVVGVPNHLTGQWADAFSQLYPNSNILAARPSDFSKENRQRLFAKILTGDFDAVILGHSSLKKIGTSPEVEKGILNEMLGEIVETIKEMKEAEKGRQRGSRQLAQMERTRDNLKAKLDKLSNIKDRDTVATFEELGFDGMFIDEAHEFKNLFYTTQMQNVAGLGDPSGSAKAFDLYLKTRYLRERYGGKAPLVFATGTPISNSLVEMFTMQRYLQPQVLQSMSLKTLDAWARVFADITQVYEVDPTGTGYRMATRFAHFQNVGDLTAIYKQMADVITMNDLQAQAEASGDRFPVPKLKGGKPVNHVAERSKDQSDYFGVETQLLDHEGKPVFDTEGNPITSYPTGTILWRVDNMPDDPREDNMLKLTNDARKAGLDMRLVDPKYADDPKSKINESVKIIAELYKQWTPQKGTQLVFCDLSVPASAREKIAQTVFYRDYKSAEIVKGNGRKHAIEGSPAWADWFVVATDQGYEVIERHTGVIAGGATTRKGATEMAKGHTGADVWKAMESLYSRRGDLTDEEVSEWLDRKAAEEGDQSSDELAVSMDELLAVESKFSVYDDMRDKLVQAGVAPNEIAFIHDYDTPEKKQKLFKQVNDGAIRILFGSTPKMGAGTNVQRRVVAIHHMDAPWRPSDLEQRNGRVIRQGNLFYEEALKKYAKPQDYDNDPDAFSIEEHRYATSLTYDTRMWQIIEHKALGIEGFRKADRSTRTMEDVAGEAANASDMKAAASGDPMIQQEIQLRNERKKLELLKSAWNRNQIELKNNEAYLADWDRRSKSKVDVLNEKIARRDANTKFEDVPAKEGEAPERKMVFEFELQDGTMTDEKGTALEQALNMIKAGKRGYFGTYRGFKLSMDKYHSFRTDTGHGLHIYTFTNDKDVFQGSPIITYGPEEKISGVGFFQRLDNYLKGLENDLAEAGRLAEFEKKRLDEIRGEIAVPFKKAEELQRIVQEHDKVKTELMQKKKKKVAATTPPPQESVDGPKGWTQVEPVAPEPVRPAETATGLDQIKKLIADENNGLTPEARRVGLAFLETPAATELDWSKLKLTVFSREGETENSAGWADISADLIAIARSSRSQTIPHEFFHFLYEYLPSNYRQAVDDARIEALEKAKAKPGLTDLERQLFDQLSSRTMTSKEFRDWMEKVRKEYGDTAAMVVRDQYYKLINPSEFIAEFGGDKFRDDQWSDRNRSRFKELWDKLTGWFRALVDAMKRTLKLAPDVEQVYRELLAGRYKRTEVKAEQPVAESIEPTAQQRAQTMDEAIKEQWIPTQVMGETDYVRGREQWSPTEIAASRGQAEQTFRDAGVRGRWDEQTSRFIPDSPWNGSEATGRRLVEQVRQAIAQQGRPGAPDIAALINSIRVGFANNDLDAFDPPTRQELYRITQAEASHRGLALGALAHFATDVSFIGNNVDVVLSRVWSDSFGGQDVASLMERVIQNFRNFFTDEEIADALKSKEEAERLIGQMIALNRRDEGNRVYRRVQALLKPKNEKKLATLKRDARIEEAVQEILAQAAREGIEPVPAPNKQLPALERLLLMVSPKNAQTIDRLISNALAEAERNAGIAAALKRATAEEREELEASFASGSDPTQDDIEEGLDLPQFSHWRSIRDNLTDYSPTTLKLVQDVVRGEFKGTSKGAARAAAVDYRIDLNQLAKQPEAEVQRVIEAHRENIIRNVQLAGATGETMGRVGRMIEQEVASQLERARERVRNPMFAEPKTGTAMTDDQRLAQQINAGLFRDERLDIPALVQRVAGRSQLQRIAPKLPELIKSVFETPFYRQNDLKEEFARQMISRFGVDEQQAETAANVFAEAFEQKFAQAKARAIKLAREAITPKEPALVTLKKSVWRRIEQAVNSGLFDNGAILREIAIAHDWTPPSDALVAQMKEWSAEEQRLRELTPAERVKAGPDRSALDKAQREKEAVTMETRVALKKKIEVEWSKLVRPIAHPFERSFWANKEHRRNFAAAANEWASANLLLKPSFIPRQLMSVLTQGGIHTPSRALAHAWQAHQMDVAKGRESELLKSVQIALKDSYKARLTSMKSALYATRAAFLGRGESRNVDRLMSGIAAVERIARQADIAEENGESGKALLLRLTSLIRLGYRVAQALDNIHGLPAEYQEMVNQVERGLREMGKTRAEIEMSKQNVLRGMNAEWIRAVDDARLIFETNGLTPSEAQIKESAWNLVKRRQYDRIRELGLPADDFEEQNRLLRSTIGWNEREVKGPGGLVGGLVTGVGRLGEAAGIPLALGRFGNAIAIGINRAFMFTPAYFLADVGPGESTWFRTETDRTQRKIEAALFSGLGILVFALVALGQIVVRLAWPRDKEERDLWEAQGIRPNTVEFHLGDGKFIPISLNTGPLQPLAPYLAAGGALNSLLTAREKAQAKLDAEALKTGLPAGKVRPMNVGDMMAVAAAAAQGSLLGGRTAAGLVSSVTDYGVPNSQKALASQIAPLVPGLPALQEVSRMAGVNLDSKMASFWDFMLPLPSSAARKVNLLGDPASTPDDLQRIIQVLTGGSYPGVVDSNASEEQQAYRALFESEYRPPSIDPNKGYAFPNGYRPMNDQELQTYTVNRGRLFKAELASVGDTADPAQARAAYQRANDQALTDLGVVPRVRVQAPVSQPASQPTSITRAPAAGLRRPSLRPASASLRLRRGRAPSRRLGRGPSLRIGRTRISSAKGRSLRLRKPSLRRR